MERANWWRDLPEAVVVIGGGFTAIGLGALARFAVRRAAEQGWPAARLGGTVGMVAGVLIAASIALLMRAVSRSAGRSRLRWLPAVIGVVLIVGTFAAGSEFCGSSRSLPRCEGLRSGSGPYQRDLSYASQAGRVAVLMAIVVAIVSPLIVWQLRRSRRRVGRWIGET